MKLISKRTRLSRARNGRLANLLLALLVLAACGPAAVAPEPSHFQEPAALPTPAGPEQPPATGSEAGGKEGFAEAISSRPRPPDPLATEGDLAQLVAGNKAFALDLYQAIRDMPGNLFFSPYSISQALAMTFAGARGETEAQMAKTLHFTLDQEHLHPAFNALEQSLTGHQEDPGLGVPAAGEDQGKPAALQLDIANAIWAQQDYAFLPSFLDLLAEHYGAGMRPVDFHEAAEQARITINDWVAQETAQRIQDLLPEGSIGRLTRMVLTNAIYFKASWADKFNAGTADGPFTLLDGSQVTVPLMSTESLLASGRGPGYQAVEVPYYGHTASMVILLPDAGDFERFEGSLTAARWNDIVSGLRAQDVALTMPTFEFSSPSISLKDVLSAMGMPIAFAGEANFSGMDGTRYLTIDDVIHKAFVAVDEEGTEAAAATAVVMGRTALQPEPDPVVVRVNRPFLFLIRDLETGTVLFVGRVLDPAM